MRSGNRLTPQLAAVLLGALMLAGCKKEIAHGLTEYEANEITVALANKGIESDKEPDKGGEKKGPSYMITVSEEYAVEAMEHLIALQLPRVHQRGLSEIFFAQSMIPTETEEKARYLEAMQGDLVNSLQSIDGIVDARVHLVLPEMSLLEGKDTTLARASVLVKYKPDWNKAVFDPDKDDAENAKFYREMIIGLEKDLRGLKKNWVETLPGLSAEDQRHLTTLKTYFTKDRDDEDYRQAKATVDLLQKSADARVGALRALQSLPKLKDLEGIIRKTNDIQVNALPMPAATIRSLVARATPRLLEDDVTVEFTKPIARPAPKKVGPLTGVRKDYFLAAAGAAGGLALILILTLVWAIGLKGAVAKAEAKARAAAAAAPPPAPAAPAG